MNIQYKFIELAARIYVAVLLSTYGMGKIMGGQFHRRGNLPPEVAEQTLANANSYDLAWTFMGYSYVYIFIIGGIQILGSGFLLFEKTKYLGIALLMPILLNIIIFDAIFFRANDYGALASAVFYFSLLLIVLILNKEKTIQLIKNIFTKSNSTFSLRKVKHILWVLGTCVLIFLIDQMMIQFFGIL